MCGKNNPLKFTELLKDTQNTSAKQGLEIALENSTVKCLLRRHYCVAYWNVLDWELANDQRRELRDFDNIREYRR